MYFDMSYLEYIAVLIGCRVDVFNL